MSKDNFYRIVIIALLLINAGTLAYLWMGRQGDEPRRGHNPVDDVIINRLKLDEAQQGQFEELKHEHHSQMMDIQRQSSKLHEELFGLLKQENKAAKDSLLGLIQEGNMQKEMVTYEHFEKLRGILRLEQQQEFDLFVEDISRQIMGPHRKHP